MRYSKQKKTILEIVNNSFDHLTADEIYLKARLIIPNISLGTVYRNLNSLKEENKIISFNSLDNKEHFDKNLMKHYHFICNNCFKIYDKKINDYDKLCSILNIDKNNTTYIDIKAYGKCNDCIK